MNTSECHQDRVGWITRIGHLGCSLLLLAVSISTVHADRDEGPPRMDRPAMPAATTHPLFSADDRLRIRDYYRARDTDRDAHDDHDEARHRHDDGYTGAKKKALPPGLRKKLERGGELPPGWRTKVARGQVLDRDLYAASGPLPHELLDHLPPEPAGTELRRIEDRVVRVMRATREIIDVLDL